jgi:hypothetical protein
MCVIGLDVRQMLNYADIGDTGVRPAELRFGTVRPAYWLEDQDSFPISLSCAASVAHTIPYPVDTVNSHPDVKTARE